MIICADDYGMRQDIDRAILQLCAAQKLSAVSCMVLFERCGPALINKIRAHERRVDIGLHFCLTHEDLPLSAPLDKIVLPSFRWLFCRALSRTLKRDEIAFLLSAQYDLFVKKFDRLPDYIDGHLHSHQLPVVADVLVQFVAGLPSASRPYIRNTRLSTTKSLLQIMRPAWKARLIGSFGARLEKKLRAANIATNDGFSGLYDFKDWQRYPEFLPQFAAYLPERTGILVTHPGFDESWRRSELEALEKFSAAVNRFQG